MTNVLTGAERFFAQWRQSNAEGNLYGPDDLVSYVGLTTIPGNGRQVSSLASYLLNNATFNIKDYGAKGDGTTDDTAKIQAAQSAAGASGTLASSAGRFRVASNLFLTSAVNFGPGVILKPDAGVNIYVEASFTGSLDQHFDLSAGGVVYFNNVGISPVYAEWFGATGGGATNDTLAIQQAIDALAYNNAHAGGEVQLLAGNYKITTLNLKGSGGPGAGVTLRGVGRYATTLLTTQASGVVISANGLGCGMFHMRVQTATGTTPTATQYLLQSTSGGACRFESVDFYKFYNGAAISGGNLSDCIFEYGLAGGIGVDLSDSIGSILTDVQVAGRYNLSACFLIQGVTRTPDTNHLIRCSTGANATPDLYLTYGTPNTGVAGIAPSVRMAKQVGGFPPRWTRFTNCAFETTVNNTSTYTFEYSAGQDTKFTSGYLYGGYYTCIMSGATANYLNEVRFTDTVIFGAYINGVYHNPADTAQAAPLSLDGCTVVDHSQNAIGGWPGVQLGANSRGFSMRGGSCGTTPGQTVRQQFGVAIDAGAKDYFIDVDSIDFTGNVTGPTSGLLQTIASGVNVTPTSPTIYISGVAAITNLLPPTRFRTVKVIPTGAFTWVATGNIAIAGAAVVSKLLIFQYDAILGKWYPSYTA